MNNIKCVERSFCFGRVNKSSQPDEPDDIFADWEVKFQLVNLNKFECAIYSYKLRMTYRTTVGSSENELNEELAFKCLSDNYKKIHHLTGIRDKNLGYPINEDLRKTSSEFEEYMVGYKKTLLDLRSN